MKKIFLLMPLLIASNCSYAAYLHINGTQFSDGDSRINFPCTGGGAPLVIYSTPVNNSLPISSKTVIEPIYVENGYNALPLTIDNISQIDEVSNNNLIVGNYNPATGAIHFGLTRADQKEFYVDSINFASINATSTSRFVSSVNVTVNEAPYYETILPITMTAGTQDFWVLVENSVKSITGTQYSWNQKGKWHTYQNTKLYPIPYNFSPQQMENNKQFYNGYGFWVCGSDNPTISNQMLKKSIYTDLLSSS